MANRAGVRHAINKIKKILYDTSLSFKKIKHFFSFRSKKTTVEAPEIIKVSIKKSYSTLQRKYGNEKAA